MFIFIYPINTTTSLDVSCMRTVVSYVIIINVFDLYALFPRHKVVVEWSWRLGYLGVKKTLRMS